MSHPEVLGVVVLARNGDRTEAYQHPITYQPGPTLSTPLGEVQSHQLGVTLRNTYLSAENPSHIRGIRTDLIDLAQVHVRVKVGAEGPAVFDSATALLQGLFPPNPANRELLANETEVIAPLGGYQYVPVETVEPSNDRSLESWTDCPAFEEHVKNVQASSEFKEVGKSASRFFSDIRDFIFGRPASMENAYNMWDYVSTELVHNRTYAHRLPPTYVEQARALADYRENLVFSDPDMAGIGNIAGRTAMSSMVDALQRIAFNGDPLQFMLIATTYQPFISIFHMTDVVQSHPELAAIPDFASAMAIELRRARAPDVRDFLRFKFKNGTSENFETIHVFGHQEDIPLTEFIYRLENSLVSSNREWARACSTGSTWATLPGVDAQSNPVYSACWGIIMAFIMMLGFWLVSKGVKNMRRREYVRLQGDEELRGVQVNEKSQMMHNA